MSYIIKIRDSIQGFTMYYHGSGWSKGITDAKRFNSQKDAEKIMREYTEHKEKGRKLTAEKYEK